MTYVLFEESGEFKTGHILSESDATLQVESATGKRSKIKRANCLFSFEAASAEDMMQQAESIAADIDPQFLWDCAPQEEFDAEALGQEYFGHPPSAAEKTGLLLCLHGAPIYFHKRSKGRYRPAPPEILAAALAAQEKKQRQIDEQKRWAEDLASGHLPDAIAEVATSLITRPDKNSQAWKALDLACTQTQKSPERLLLELGAWPHPLALHKERFLATHFSQGTDFPAIEVPGLPVDLPLADVEAYSVDDITTTEIDDALSVTTLPSGLIRVGIHVAAPGLVVTKDSVLDRLARARMSTVYMPGEKIPMQPEHVVSSFSLDAGKAVPAVSLYITADPRTGEIQGTESKLERLVVRENLRHPHLEAHYTEAALSDHSIDIPYAGWIRPLWQLAGALAAKREAVRGKPENNNRVEYSFYVDGDPNHPDSPVRLVPRMRNAPLDRLIAEFMILANSTWGGLLAQHNVPGIYRSQQAGRVRMSTHPLPHEAIGVPQYAWMTSPLRRYVDLVNQWQLIAAIQHGISAPLVAPFKPRDADLFGVIGAFDAQYSAWNEFQSNMERFWCLRWLKQQNIQRCVGHVLREDLVRFANAPLVTRLTGMPALERGTAVELEVIATDELALDLECRFVGAVPIHPEPDSSGQDLQG